MVRVRARLEKRLDIIARRRLTLKLARLRLLEFVTLEELKAHALSS